MIEVLRTFIYASVNWLTGNTRRSHWYETMMKFDTFSLQGNSDDFGL